MEKAGWNQAELARKLSWQPQHLSNYMTGTEPGLDKIAEIAAVFGVSVAELLDSKTPPEPRIERTSLSEEMKEAVFKAFGDDPKKLMQEAGEYAYRKMIEDIQKGGPATAEIAAHLWSMPSVKESVLKRAAEMAEDMKPEGESAAKPMKEADLATLNELTAQLDQTNRNKLAYFLKQLLAKQAQKKRKEEATG